MAILRFPLRAFLFVPAKKETKHHGFDHSQKRHKWRCPMMNRNWIAYRPSTPKFPVDFVCFWKSPPLYSESLLISVVHHTLILPQPVRTICSGTYFRSNFFLFFTHFLFPIPPAHPLYLPLHFFPQLSRGLHFRMAAEAQHPAFHLTQTADSHT